MYYGKKIKLRHLKLSDLDHFMKHWNDLELRITLGGLLPVSRPKEEEFIKKTWDLMKKGEGYIFAITTFDDQFLGTVGLHAVKQMHQTASLGIAIHQKSNQGRGYGPDAIITICGLAFLHLNLHSVEPDYLENNQYGRKAYEKAGFKPAGVRREAFYRDGKFMNLYKMDILKEEWMEQFSTENNLIKPSN